MNNILQNKRKCIIIIVVLTFSGLAETQPKATKTSPSPPSSKNTSLQTKKPLPKPSLPKDQESTAKVQIKKPPSKPPSPQVSKKTQTSTVKPQNNKSPAQKAATPKKALKKAPPKRKNKKAQKSSTQDEVLEELQLFNKGIDTQSNVQTKTSSQKSTDNTSAVQKDLNISEPKTAKKNQILLSEDKKGIDSQIKALHQQKTAIFESGPVQSQFIQLTEQYKKIIQENPDQPKAHWGLFHLLDEYIKWTQNTNFYNAELNSQALAVLNGIQIKFGESQQTTRYLCEYLIVNHFYNEGLIQCSRSIRMNSQNPTPYLLQFLHSSDNKDKKKLLKILKKFPKSPSVLVFVGRFFKDQNNDELSIRYFKKAIQIDPDFVSGIQALASVLFHKGQYSQALSYYFTACQKNYLKSITAFRKAKSLLSQKSLFKLANDYQSQINLCMTSQS